MKNILNYTTIIKNEDWFQSYLREEIEADQTNFYIEGSSFHRDLQYRRESVDKILKKKVSKRYTDTDKIVNSLYKFKKSIIFVAPGGMGKTKQMIEMYNNLHSTILNYDDKAIIFSKNITKHIYTKEFNDFISKPKNILFIDALNECEWKLIEAVIKKKKCMLIMSSRESISKHYKSIFEIQYDPHISIFDFAKRIGLPKNFDLNLLSLVGLFSPREAILFLYSVNDDSHGSSKPGNSPLATIRDRFERYYIRLAREEDLSRKSIWKLLKSKEGLIEKLGKTFTKSQFLKQQNMKMFNIFLKWNIIQPWGDKYIFSNDMFFLVIKLMNKLEGEKLTYSSKEFKVLINEINPFWIRNGKEVILFEFLYRKYKKRKTIDVDDVLKDFKDLTPRWDRDKKTIARMKANFKERERERRELRKERRENDRTKNKHIKLSGGDIYYRNRAYDGTGYRQKPEETRYVNKLFSASGEYDELKGASIEPFDWVNTLGMLGNFIRLKDRKRIIYKVTKIDYVDLSRANVIDLISNIKLPVKFIEMDRKSFNNDAAFESNIRFKRVLHENKKLLVSYLTYGFTNINRKIIRELEMYQDIGERELRRILKKSDFDFKFWYIYNNISEKKLKYPRRLKKVIKLSFRKNDSVDLIKKDMLRINDIIGKANDRKDYELIRAASYASDDYHDFETFLTANLPFSYIHRNLQWYFISRINSIINDPDSFLATRYNTIVTYQPKLIHNNELNQEIHINETKSINPNIYYCEIAHGKEKIYLKGTNDAGKNNVFRKFEKTVSLPSSEKIETMVLSQYKNGYLLESDYDYKYVLMRKDIHCYRWDTELKHWEVLTEEYNGTKFIESFESLDTKKDLREFNKY